jgi:DNA (cytosine-5)-methyltransferase 1
LNTIEKYRERYRTGQYGWRRLDYDSPAPSFGNVTKTYVLHPEAGESGFDERILSVRELLCIMGFPKEFHFPEGIPLPRRYQMVADVVSPVFSEACAHVTREMLATGAGYGHSGS